jgi:archaemetzincin
LTADPPENVPVGPPVLAAVGEFPEDLLKGLSERTGIPVSVAAVDPQVAWSPARGQYGSNRLLQEIRESTSGPVLAATSLDLYLPVLTFVFGEAELGGRVGIFSIHRLREEFYGLPPRPGLLFERAVRELWHELGHIYGLTHCRNASCVMSPSHSVAQVDVKSESFCPDCLMLARRTQRTLPSALNADAQARVPWSRLPARRTLPKFAKLIAGNPRNPR